MYMKPSSPLPIGGVLDDGFSLYRHCLKDTFVFAFVAALVSVPFSRLFPAPTADPVQLGLTPLVAWLGMLVVTLLFYMPIIAKIDALQKGHHLTIHQAMSVTLRRFHVILAVGLIYIFGMMIGFVLFLIPGLYVAVTFGFALIASLTEWQGVGSSLRYSFRLVHRRWWRTALLFIIITIVAVVLSTVYFLIIGGILAFGAGQALAAGEPPPWYIELVAAPVMTGLLVPLMLALVMAVYADSKLRYEGADIAERIAAAEA